MKTAINVGVSKEVVAELGKVILSILNSKQDQATQQIALETVRQGVQGNNTAINNCSFQG